MHMWYWAIMVLLILGSIALLCSTFISVKKNKAQDAERRKQSKKGKRYKADQGYDPEEEEDQPQADPNGVADGAVMLHEERCQDGRHNQRRADGVPFQHAASGENRQRGQRNAGTNQREEQILVPRPDARPPEDEIMLDHQPRAPQRDHQNCRKCRPCGRVHHLFRRHPVRHEQECGQADR